MCTFNKHQQAKKAGEEWPPAAVEDAFEWSPPLCIVKTIVEEEKKEKTEARAAWLDSDEDGNGDDDFDVWAALEEAAARLGYTPEDMTEMLSDEANFPPPDNSRRSRASRAVQTARRSSECYSHNVFLLYRG